MLTLIAFGLLRSLRTHRHWLGEFLVGDPDRGALRRDLGAEVGAALAVTAPAEVVERRFRFGEPFACARPRLFEPLPPRREHARSRLVVRARLFARERLRAGGGEGAGNSFRCTRRLLVVAVRLLVGRGLGEVEVRFGAGAAAGDVAP